MSDPEPYPFESDDDIQIRELDLESVDSFGNQRVTVGELVDENESWRFGHVIVDEAQDLTPMQWRMVMRRVRGRSLTVVGDLAQQSKGHVSSWSELLPSELQRAARQDLTVNYRSPAEIQELAVRVLADFAPDVAPSQALRSSGNKPEFRRVRDLAMALPDAVEELLHLVGGQIGVIGKPDATEGITSHVEGLGVSDLDRVSILTPNGAKGLEFDAVIIAEPADLWAGESGPAQLYIALTRATHRLVILHQRPLPAVLQP